MKTVEGVRSWLRSADRGVATGICRDTVLTAPEISRFVHGERDLPADKMLVLIDWLEGHNANWRDYVHQSN